jgi:hypothetical protein
MSLVCNRFQLIIDKCRAVFRAHQNGDPRGGDISVRHDGNDLVLAPYTNGPEY